MRKTLVSAALVFGGLVAAALFAGPALVDWEKVKPRVVAALEARSGLDVAIEGPMSFATLWRPTVRAARVRVAGIAVEAVDLRVAWLPLAWGELRIESVRLEAPDVLLERDADGTPNAPLEALRVAAAGDGVAVARVSVAGGRLRYRDRSAGVEEEFADVDLALTLDPATGALGAEGSGRWRGLPIDGVVSLDPAAGGARFRVRLASGDSSVAFRGEVPARRFAGRLAVEGEAAVIVPRLLAAAGARRPAFAFAPGVRFEAESPVRYDDGEIAAPELAVRVADAALEGALTVTAAPRRFSLSLAAGRLNLDALAAAVAPGVPDGSGEPRRGLDGDVSLAVDTLLYRERLVRRAALEADVSGGAVAVERLAGELPGGSTFAFARHPSAEAGGALFDGRIEAASDNPRALLAWLGIEAPAVAADRLRRFSLAAAVEGGRRAGRLTDAALVLDTTAASGSAAWTLATRPAFELDLDLDRIDLDAYLRHAADDLAAAALAAFDARVALAAETVTLAGVAMREVAVRGSLRDGALTLDELGIGDLAGGEASAAGTLADLGAAPAVRATVRFRTADLSAAAGAVPALRGLPPGIAVALKAGLSGGRDRIAIDAVLTAPAGEAAVRGTVVDPVAAPLFDLAGVLESPDAARLLEAFGVVRAGASEGLLAGPATLEAGFVGSPRAMAFDADARLDGGGRVSANGTIDGDIAARRLHLDATASHPEFSRLLPLLAGADPAAVPAALAGPAAARATVAGDAGALALDAAVDFAGGALTMTGTVADAAGSPSFDLAVALDHPAMAPLLAGFGVDTSLARRPGAIAVRARVAGTPSGFDVRDLDADLGGARVAGAVALDLAAPRPKLTGDLAAGAVAADMVLRAAAGAAGAAAGAAGAAADGRGAARSSQRIDLSALRSVDADLRLAADSLDIGGLPFADADLRLMLDDGTLEVAALTGRLFGGAAAARGRLAAGAVPRLDGTISVDGADVAAALAHLAGTGSMTGVVDFEMRFAAAGESERQMILALAGEGALNGAGGGWIDGIDLAAVAAVLGAVPETGRLPDLADAAAGRTAWRDLGGAFRVAGGRLRADDLRLAFDGAAAVVSVDADLMTRRHEIAATVRFDAHPGLPPLVLARRGPLDAPRFDSPAAAAARVLEARVVSSPVEPAEPAAAPAPARDAEPEPPASTSAAAALPPPPGSLAAPPARADAFDSMLGDFLGE